MALSLAALHSLGQENSNEVQYDFLLMVPIASSMAPLYSLGQDNQIEIHKDFFSYVMALASHHTMALSMAHGIDASTGTSMSTNGQIIPLNNHLNIANSMVSLIASSPLCYCHVHKEEICPSNATYMLHMPISSFAHITFLYL